MIGSRKTNLQLLSLFRLEKMASVELLNVMGDDLMVVNAARVSFAKESHEFSLADEKLINYLAKHNHVSPFFHPQIQFQLLQLDQFLPQ